MIGNLCRRSPTSPGRSSEPARWEMSGCNQRARDDPRVTSRKVDPIDLTDRERDPSRMCADAWQVGDSACSHEWVPRALLWRRRIKSTYVQYVPVSSDMSARHRGTCSGLDHASSDFAHWATPSPSPSRFPWFVESICNTRLEQRGRLAPQTVPDKLVDDTNLSKWRNKNAGGRFEV